MIASLLTAATSRVGRWVVGGLAALIAFRTLIAKLQADARRQARTDVLRELETQAHDRTETALRARERVRDDLDADGLSDVTADDPHNRLRVPNT